MRILARLSSVSLSYPSRRIYISTGTFRVPTFMDWVPILGARSFLLQERVSLRATGGIHLMPLVIAHSLLLRGMVSSFFSIISPFHPLTTTPYSFNMVSSLIPGTESCSKRGRQGLREKKLNTGETMMMSWQNGRTPNIQQL